MIITILINALGLIAAYYLARRLFSNGQFVDLVLSLAVVFYAQLIIVQIFWGILGRLSVGSLILSSGVIFGVVLLLFKPKISATASLIPSQQKSPGLNPGMNVRLLGEGALQMALVLKAKFIKIKKMPRTLVREAPLLPEEIIQNKTVIFCLAVLCGFGLVKLAINLVNPPFGWDSLNYHFTFPVEWLKHANLQNPITINDDLGPTYYPINGSLIYSWFILPLKNVFLADLGQFPFFVISFLAVYGLCRCFKIIREYSFYAAALFSITPNYFKQMEIAYVDVMVCAWFLAGLYFLISFYQQKKLKDAALFSLSLGLLIGTKTIALLYGALLFIGFTAVLIRVSKVFGWRRVVFYFSFSVLLIVICGGYGYIRNFLQTGNPMYPLEVKFLHREIFKGVYDKSNYTAHVIQADYAITKILFSEGLGSGLIIFAIPGFFLAFINVLRRKFSAEKSFVFLMPLALYLLWRYLIPLANLRYLYPAFAIAYIAPFYAISTNRRFRIAARILVVLCFLASAFEISNRLELIASILLSGLLFFSLKPLYKIISGFKIRNWVLIFLIVAAGLYLANIDYNKNEYQRYVQMEKYSGFWPDATRAWRWLDQNTSGNNIAYVGRPVPFPLYGTNFKNNVFYVSVNETEPAMIHYFPHSYYTFGSDFMDLHRNLEAEGNYRQHPNYDNWLSNLKKRQADYLFVYSLHQTKETVFPLEDSWAGAHPEKFISSFSNSTIHIYKIR